VSSFTKDICSGKINVNTASAADLDKLPGIGAVLSARIIDYRTKNGPFQNLDDLRKVEGLSKAVADKLKDLIEF
jgi:competence protein ComEA